MTPSSIAVLIVLWIVATGAGLAFAFRREITRAWREPVLTVPVLIVESDDWGFGPLEQAERLRDISSVLGRYRDASGNPAVMTLGAILAGPHTGQMAAERCQRYHRSLLAEPVRAAMCEGTESGVFALQLHGMEHYWPPALLAEASRNPSVRAWLSGPPNPPTEALPSALQSRWIDASALPSKELAAEAIAQAAQEEAKVFEQAFGSRPVVGVPTTFVWTPEVERAWAGAGIRVLVTPGRRYGGRDAAGRPVRAASAFHNGQQGASGLTYLVRDDYFEPALGHGAERGLAALALKSRLGRPTLLETHRANFLGDAAKAENSIAELDRLLAAALGRFPEVRFMSSAELARHYLEPTTLVERRLLARLHCFVLRLARVTRLRKLAVASGVALPAAVLWLATRPSRQAA